LRASVENSLCIYGNENIATHHYTAVFHRIIPTHTKIVAVDPSLRHKADTRIVKGRIPLTQIPHLQRDLPCNPTNRQIASDFSFVTTDALDFITFESDGRMVFYVKEISAAQVLITLWLSGPEFLGIDDHLDGRVHWIRRIKLQRAVHVLEVTAHPRNHHVPDAKLSGSMSRLESPFRHFTQNSEILRFPFDYAQGMA